MDERALTTGQNSEKEALRSEQEMAPQLSGFSRKNCNLFWTPQRFGILLDFMSLNSASLSFSPYPGDLEIASDCLRTILEQKK